MKKSEKNTIISLLCGFFFFCTMTLHLSHHPSPPDQHPGRQAQSEREHLPQAVPHGPPGDRDLAPGRKEPPVRPGETQGSAQTAAFPGRDRRHEGFRRGQGEAWERREVFPHPHGTS